MKTRRIHLVLYVLQGWMLLSAGCAARDRASEPAQRLCLENATRQAVVLAAEDVLARMHFAIDKCDPEAGIIRTRPLRAGQFFEFWRSDNAGAFNAAEANVQTVRRSVALRVKDGDGQACVEGEVRVERLSLPENKIASISQGYQIHSRSNPGVQTFQVTPPQRLGMAWIELGRDPALTAEILKRIERKLDRQRD